MPILPIIKYPNAILRLKAKNIKNPLDPKIQELVLAIKETLNRKNNGLGLAAPQVGESVKLFVVINEGRFFIFIDPQIKSFSKETSVMEEGCLSFPGKFIAISRPENIKVRYLDETGKKCKIKADGLFARAIQHEMDHLNGILIIDKIKSRHKKNGKK